MRRLAAPLALVMLVETAPATAADSVRVAVSATEDETGAVLTVKAEGGETPAATASVAGGILTMRFAAPVTADLSAIAGAAPRTFAAARLAEEGRVARFSLRRNVEASVSQQDGALRVTLKPTQNRAAGGEDGAVVAPTANASVTVSERANGTRLAFRFASKTKMSVSQTGSRLQLTFSPSAELDASALRVRPPKWVQSVERPQTVGGKLRLAMALESGVTSRSFNDDGVLVLDLDAPAKKKEDAPALPPPPPPPQTAEASASRDPAPKNGVAPVEVTSADGEMRIAVSWAAPARAAAFRRGDAIWILFDSAGKLDLRAGKAASVAAVRGDHVVGMRIDAAPSANLSATLDGNVWRFAIGPRRATFEPAPVRRERSVAGDERMVVDFGRDGVVREIADAGAGDKLAVALVPGAPRGVEGRRSTTRAAILPSVTGAAVELNGDGMRAAFEAGALVVSKQSDAAPAPLDAIAPLQTQALLDLRREAAVPDPQVIARRDELSRRAAAEGTDEGAHPEARLALARFLLAHQLAFEALGALKFAAIHQPQLESDPAFRLMRAAANVMAGRLRDAKPDLDASALADDPAAALWRGYVAAQEQRWQDARRELERGDGAIAGQPPEWRGAFELAHAQALEALGARAEALAAANRAEADGPSLVSGRAQILKARLEAADGRETTALHDLDALEKSKIEEISVRATFETARLDAAMGKPVADRLEILERLRLRWRGDGLESAITRELGQAYAQAGQWRAAFTVLRSGATRRPADESSRVLREDMNDLFERLFLDDEADKLEPIQALGLFYDFKELTPVGPNGDRMVRNLAGRLVALDLLEQAAGLLQYQVDQRLEGVGRTQIAADLAAIYIDDGKPEKAIVALESSRQPNIPASLVQTRRILEAKALLDMNQVDHALETLERDHSPEAQQLRAEAAWAAKDWPKAAAELDKVLAARPSSGALDESDRAAVMRAAVAAVLSSDEKRVAALRARYGDRMAETPDAAAFELVTSTAAVTGGQIADVAKAVARNDLLRRFIDGLKAKMSGAPAPKA